MTNSTTEQNPPADEAPRTVSGSPPEAPRGDSDRPEPTPNDKDEQVTAYDHLWYRRRPQE